MTNRPASSPALLRAERTGTIVEAPGRPEWVGQDLAQLVAESDRARVRAALDRADGRPEAIELAVEGWPPQGRIVVAGDHDVVLVGLRPDAAQALALDEMVSVVAHEVKNPLAGIGGALDVLRSGLDADSRHRRIAEAAKQRVQALDGILEDLLLLTRPIVLDPAPTPLWTTLSEVTRRAASESPQAPVPELGVSGRDPMVRADPVLLPRALFYLVDHAIRTSERPVQIQLPDAEREAEIVVHLAAGPLEHDIGNRVFDPHFLERSRRTGLHLPVARRILEAHGGGVHLELGAAPDQASPDRLRARLPL